MRSNMFVIPLNYFPFYIRVSEGDTLSVEVLLILDSDRGGSVFFGLLLKLLDNNLSAETILPE